MLCSTAARPAPGLQCGSLNRRARARLIEKGIRRSPSDWGESAASLGQDLLRSTCCAALVAQHLLRSTCCAALVAQHLLRSALVAQHLLRSTCCAALVAQHLLRSTCCAALVAHIAVRRPNFSRLRGRPRAQCPSANGQLHAECKGYNSETGESARAQDGGVRWGWRLLANRRREDASLRGATAGRLSRQCRRLFRGRVAQAGKVGVQVTVSRYLKPRIRDSESRTGRRRPSRPASPT